MATVAWRRLVVLLAAAVVLAGLRLIGEPSPTAAYEFLGCKFAGRSPVVHYRAQQLGEYQSVVHAAARAWNRAARLPIRFTRREPTRPGVARVVIRRTDSVLDAWAWIGRPDARPPRCLGGPTRTYRRNRTSIYLNHTALQTLTAQQRELVVIHELGHALGLGHERGNCQRVQSVMVQGPAKWTCGWSGKPPWRDDRRGVRRLYGSSPS